MNTSRRGDYTNTAVMFAAIIGGIVLTALLFFLVYQIRSVLPPFIYAFIIVYVLRPAVDFMVNKNIPRLAAVSIIYLIVLIAMTISGLYLVPLLISQISDFATNFPKYFQGGLAYFSKLKIAFYRIHMPKTAEGLLLELADKIRVQAFSGFSGIPETTMIFFGGIFNFVIAPIIAFYLLKDLPDIKTSMLDLLPVRFRPGMLHVMKEIDFAVGGFIRGQVLVSLVIGATISIYLWAIGVKFPVLLGLLAGILNIIPYFGPVLGGGVAAMVALVESPRLALWVVVGMFAIQQFDSTIVSPNIMRHAVNLHPVIVILSLLVGGTLFGFMGLLLAIPVAAVIKALVLHYVYAQPVQVDEEE